MCIGFIVLQYLHIFLLVFCGSLWRTDLNSDGQQFINVNKMNNHLSSQITEYTIDHDICGNSCPDLGIVTKMRLLSLAFFLLAIVFTVLLIFLAFNYPNLQTFLWKISLWGNCSLNVYNNLRLTQTFQLKHICHQVWNINPVLLDPPGDKQNIVLHIICFFYYSIRRQRLWQRPMV